MERPHIPLPGCPDDDGDGDTAGATAAITKSAAQGRETARLLDPEAPVPGITEALLRLALAAIAVPVR